MINRLGGVFAAMAWAVVSLSSCGTLPTVKDKPVTSALAQPSSGPLAETSIQVSRGRPTGHSSVLLLENNKEALEWRLALIDSARSSIDIQLYLWHKGAASTLLFDRLLKAADRGVRVRLLVDDFLLQGQERDIAALCREHPKFKIRIFNPQKWRGTPLHRMVEFIASFNKLNRRMHNKTWTVDRCMTIVGGRNVADHYFGLDPKYNFVDFDVLASGPVVSDVSDGFDEYWNASGSYPGAKLSRWGTTNDVEDIRDLLRNKLKKRRDDLQAFPVGVKDWSQELATLRRTMVHGRVQFVGDRAEAAEDNRHTVTTLRSTMYGMKKEVIVVSPYLIPSTQGIKNLSRLIESGVEVQILVPSLAANNQALVHGHYRKYRRPLIKIGARLFEMRKGLSQESLAMVDTPPIMADRICLHGKVMVGDRKQCFIGSLNLDPRAMEINTESGLLIESRELTAELLATLKTLTKPQNAWEVKINPKGKLHWHAGGERSDTAPKAGFKARILSVVSGILPIKSQL